jgi:glycosyltransferase involved in cell wall biosynthesis
MKSEDVMQPKINVLALFLHNSTWGMRIRGDERRFLEIAKRLVKYGVELNVIEYAPSLQKFYYQNIIYRSFELKTRKLIGTIIWLMNLALKLRRYDIIYAYNQDLLNLVGAILFKLIRRKPLVVVVQSLQDVELPLKSLKQMYGATVLDFIFICLHRYILLPLTLRLANAIFTVSNTLKNTLITKYPSTRGKVFTTLNGVDINKFRPLNLRKEYDAIFLGRMHIQHKGINKLLLAWKYIVRKHPRAKLILVGGFENENDKKLLYSLIDKLNLRDNVIVTGFVEDEEIVQLLNKAKIFISLSTYEGFGLSIIEALACGLPVIASNLEVFHELHKDLLFYVPNGSPKILTALLNEFLNSHYDSIDKSLIVTLQNHAKNFIWDFVAHNEFTVMTKLFRS